MERVTPRSDHGAIVAGIACALLVGLPVSAFAGAPSARKLHDRGAAAFKAGEFREAARLFHAAFEKKPEPAFLFSEASCYRRLDEPATAAEIYDKYLVLVPDGERPEEREKALGYAAETRLASGIMRAEAGDCAAAISELERALGHRPGLGEPWFRIGRCRETLGDATLARVAYEKALAAPVLDGALRSEVESHLRALDARATAAASMPASAPAIDLAAKPGHAAPSPDGTDTVVVAPLKKKRGLRPLHIGLIILGGVVVVVGVPLVGLVYDYGLRNTNVNDGDLPTIVWTVN